MQLHRVVYSCAPWLVIHHNISANYCYHSLFFGLKKMKQYNFLPLIAILAATGAQAELTYGNAFVNYHAVNSDAFDDDATVLGGAAEFTFGGWQFGGEITNVEFEGIDLFGLTFVASYRTPSGFTVGADFTTADFDGTDTGASNLFVMYDPGAFAIGAAFGEAEDIDDTSYTLFGSYDITHTTRLGVDFIDFGGNSIFGDDRVVAVYADIRTDRFEVKLDVAKADDNTIYAASGQYMLNDKWAITGSLARLDGLGFDGDAASIGGKYYFTPDVSAKLGIGYLDTGGGDDGTLITLGLQYETGQRTAKRRTTGNIVTSILSGVAGLNDF